MIRRPPWRQQPQTFAQINRGHPLARGLTVAINHISRFAPNAVGRFPTPAASSFSPTIVATRLGMGIQITSGSGSGIRVPITTETASSLSVFCLFSSPDTGAVQIASSGQSNGQIPVRFESGALGSRQNSTQVTGGTVAAGELVAHGVSWNGTAIRLFKTGVFVGSGTGSGGSISGDWIIGGNGFGASHVNTTLLTYIWDRPLTDSEHEWAGTEPWALWQPRQIWVPVSAAGGATTINGAIGTATASGLQAGISETTRVAGGIGSAAASGLQAGIAETTAIAGGVGVSDASGLHASITAPGGFDISGNVGTAQAFGQQAQITVSDNAVVSLGWSSKNGRRDIDFDLSAFYRMRSQKHQRQVAQVVATMAAMGML